MSKIKAAAMIFGGLTTCMAGVVLAGYVVSPTVGTAASRNISTVSENMNGAVSYVNLENTVITDSSKKKTDATVIRLNNDSGNNVENIRETADTSEIKQNEEYKFAVTNITPASYEEPVFVPVQESSVDIYSQYKGETPANVSYAGGEVPADENSDNHSEYVNNASASDDAVSNEETKEHETFDFTIEEITEPETEEVTEPVTEEVTEPETEEVTEPVTEEVTEPETEEVTEPVTEEVTEPVTEEVTEPETEEVTEPETEYVAPVTTQYVVEITPTVTTQYVAQPAEPETTQPQGTQTSSTPTIPLSDSEYIALCNAVAHEAGCNWISTRDKANVVEVIMNRVYSSLFPNSVIEVLTQQNQFTGAESYAYLGYFTSDVSQDVIDAVALYFSDQSSFNEGYLYFYGDGYQNHFSQGGWW
ncbi:MAG: cell wall hydrolase [Ruminococcus sp.]|nr:cell wall hydrolase [Ruminococcus sp.]